MMNIFEDECQSAKTVKGVVRFVDGNMNVIRDAGLFTVPEMDKIAEQLAAGNNKIRSNERKEEMFSAILDIKTYERNDKIYYFVGEKGMNMKQKIERAGLIRSAEGYNGATVRFEKMLPMMDVSWVRNGQLTVVPFPFKYLHEYVELLRQKQISDS